MVMVPLIGFTIVNSNFFQSIDKPWVAIVTSLSRQVIFLVPMSIFIPMLYEKAGWIPLNGVWISLTISDVLGAVLAAILLYSQRHVFSLSNEEIGNREQATGNREQAIGNREQATAVPHECPLIFSSPHLIL